MKHSSPTTFVTFKSARALPVISHLVRDFMIQSALDSTVRSIDYIPTFRLDDGMVPVNAIILDRDDGKFVIDMVDVHAAGEVDPEGFLALAFELDCTGIIAVLPADIRREPRFSSAREVWGHHTLRIHPNDRTQVLDALEAEGPIPLRALEGLVSTRDDAVAVAKAMACEGTLDLDLRLPLNGRSIVRACAPRRRQPMLAFGT